MNSQVIKSRNVIFSVALTLISVILSACAGSSDGGGGSPAPRPTPINPYIGQCQVGQIFHTTYGCLNQNSCQPSYGWVPSLNQCLPGTPVGSGGGGQVPTDAGTYGGTLNFVNQDQFDLLFKATGQCDYWTWSVGTASCEYWSDRGAYLQFVSSGGANPAINLTVLSGSTGLYSYGSWLSVSSLATKTLYNNSQGYQLTSASYGIKLMVPEGKLGSSETVLGELYFQGVKVALVNIAKIR